VAPVKREAKREREREREKKSLKELSSIKNSITLLT
jgi:hypothetical protein